MSEVSTFQLKPSLQLVLIICIATTFIRYWIKSCTIMGNVWATTFITHKHVTTGNDNGQEN